MTMACDVFSWSLVFAGYSLLESLVMLIANVLFILMYNCGVNSLTNLHGYVEGDECKKKNGTKDFIFTPQIFSTIQICFIPLYLLWIIGATIILSQSCCKIRTHTSYIFWSVVGMIIILMDTAVGICLSIDYTKELPNGPTLGLVLIMFKGGVFYVLNIVALIIMIRAIHLVKKRNEELKRKKYMTKKASDALRREMSEIDSEPPLTPLPLPIERRDSLPTKEVVEELQLKQEIRAANAKYNNLQREYANQYLNKSVSFEDNYREPIDADETRVYNNVGDNNQYYHRGVGQSYYPERSSFYRKSGVPYPPEDLSSQQDSRHQPHSHYDRPIIHPRVRYNRESAREPHSAPFGDYENKVYTNPAFEGDNYHRERNNSPRTHHNNRMNSSPKHRHRESSRRSKESKEESTSASESSKNQQIQETDKKPKAPVNSSAFDLRPFSYMNPTVRPNDHMDIKTMEEHPVDTVKVLEEEVKKLNEKETEKTFSANTGGSNSKTERKALDKGQDSEDKAQGKNVKNNTYYVAEV